MVVEGQEVRLVALAHPRQPDDYFQHLNSFSVHLHLLCDSILQQPAKKVPVRAALAWTHGEEGEKEVRQTKLHPLSPFILSGKGTWTRALAGHVGCLR